MLRVCSQSYSHGKAGSPFTDPTENQVNSSNNLISFLASCLCFLVFAAGYKTLGAISSARGLRKFT